MKLTQISTESSSQYYELNNEWNGTHVREGQGSSWSGRPLKEKEGYIIAAIAHNSNSNGYGQTEVYIPKGMVTVGYWGTLCQVTEMTKTEEKLLPIFQKLTEGCYNQAGEGQIFDKVVSLFPDIRENTNVSYGSAYRVVQAFVDFINMYPAEFRMIEMTPNNAAFFLWIMTNAERVSKTRKSRILELYEYNGAARFDFGTKIPYQISAKELLAGQQLATYLIREISRLK